MTTIVLLLLAAAEGWSDRQQSRLQVPDGHDPEIFCEACCRLVTNLEEELVPKLEAVVTKAEARSQRSATLLFGELDSLADEKVEKGCALTGLDPTAFGLRRGPRAPHFACLSLPLLPTAHTIETHARRPLLHHLSQREHQKVVRTHR